MCDWREAMHHYHYFRELRSQFPGIEGCASPEEKAIILKTVEKIKAYFRGEIRRFPIKSAAPFGTELQRAVWAEIAKIPYGTTLTYAELAERVGRPQSFRAVANACGANPLSILVPCHRVVGKNNSGGYAGGILAKETLLMLEKNNRNEANFGFTFK